MQYNNRHQTPDTRHWQTYVLNLCDHNLFKLTQTSKYLPKLSLVLIPLLLAYSVNTQALSTSTSKMINGSAPYITFDNGVTKITKSDELLGITISDGTTQTSYTPANNTSTVEHPIVLSKENQSFTDIGMLIPSSNDSITLNDIIGEPNNYWGDDDGDGANGITIDGSLSVSITDNVGNQVSRSDTLDLCKAPYKVELTSTSASLTTKYGVPNSSTLSNSTATYYISPKTEIKVCYARPNVINGHGNNAGPDNIWVSTKGFLLQSIEPSGYNRNFPTTGANNLHFDLLITGIDVAKLRWPTVTHGGITATVTLFNPPLDANFNPDGSSSVRITLTGPTATSSQWSSASPGSVDIPNLPQTFELVGLDSNNKAVLKYGFVLKQWFVNRGSSNKGVDDHLSWCTNIGGGYRLSRVKDLTNALLSGVEGATPSSDSNHYKRIIGAGFFTEWGDMVNYTNAGFDISVAYYNYWTSDKDKLKQFYVYSHFGNVFSQPTNYNGLCLCAYP